METGNWFPLRSRKVNRGKTSKASLVMFWMPFPPRTNSLSRADVTFRKVSWLIRGKKFPVNLRTSVSFGIGGMKGKWWPCFSQDTCRFEQLQNCSGHCEFWALEELHLKHMYMYTEKITTNVHHGIFVYRFTRQLKIPSDNNTQRWKFTLTGRNIMQDMRDHAWRLMYM